MSLGSGKRLSRPSATPTDRPNYRSPVPASVRPSVSTQRRISLSLMRAELRATDAWQRRVARVRLHAGPSETWPPVCLAAHCEIGMGSWTTVLDPGDTSTTHRGHRPELTVWSCLHAVRLATVGSRAFPVAAAHTWNSLPEHTVSASTLQSFKRHLKTFLLQQSFRLAL